MKETQHGVSRGGVGLRPVAWRDLAQGKPTLASPLKAPILLQVTTIIQEEPNHKPINNLLKQTIMTQRIEHSPCQSHQRWLGIYHLYVVSIVVLNIINIMVIMILCILESHLSH